MKRASWATALLLIIVMIIGLGCASDKEGGTVGGTEVGSVQIILATDTLQFIPGDSASAPGFIVVTDREGRVMQGQRVNISLAPAIGYIEYSNTTLKDTTNEYGRVEFYFRSYNQSGNTTITAAIGNKSASWPLAVLPMTVLISRVNITLSADSIYVPPATEDSAFVTVSVTDSSGNGVPNLQVNLSASGGRLIPLAPTDASGRATTWWFTNHQQGHFTLRVGAGGLSDSTTVFVQEMETQRGTLRLSASTRLIRADRCVSRAQVVAVLKDRYSTAVPGDTIIFSAPYLGRINAWAITDTSGMAMTDFCENFTPCADSLDSAYVVARHVKWSLRDTIRFMIEPASRVSVVHLSANTTQGTAGVDSATLSVHAYYEDGAPVYGLHAYFSATCSHFAQDSMLLINGTTQTSNYWKFCDQTTNAQYRVGLSVTVGDAVSDTLWMDVTPGGARQIDVTTLSSVIPINETMGIVATVRDSLNNLVRDGVPVMFTSTLGTISPPSPVPTGVDGRAIATLNPGTQAGQVVIKGTIAGIWMDSTVATVLSGTPGTIQLTVSNASPQVAGTGGIDWTQLIATVYDANGNPVQDGQWVTFTIMADPGGCSINRRGLVDSAQTAAGSAMVTFNSGSIPGPVVIQACTYANLVNYCVQASNITVIAGPPRAIYIQPTDVGSGTEGVAWDISVAALVGDLYNNPVRDGIAVFFEVEPEIALILSDTVITGNGVHHPGMAYTTLRYPSDVTFQTVTIRARTAGAEAVSAEIEYILPLQSPTITLYPLPSTWHFAAPPPQGGTPCRIRLLSIVRDGHNRLITGATVIYSTTSGRIYKESTGTTTAYMNKTGSGEWGNYANGQTELWLVDSPPYIFPDPNVNEITADVQVEVEGYQVAIDGQVINFRRGNGGPGQN